MPFVRDKKTGEIVDHERNAVLRSVQGYSSGYKEWEIDWDGEVFGWMAKDTRKYGGPHQNTPIGIDWFVASMKIPESLKDRRVEIMEMIKDSLQAKWKKSGWDGDAKVEFDPRLMR